MGKKRRQEENSSEAANKIVRNGGSSYGQSLNKENTNNLGPLLCDQYEIMCQVGEGTYGKVYKAKHKSRDQLVAIKKMRKPADTREGVIFIFLMLFLFPLTTAREIKYLKMARNHPNIIQLFNVFLEEETISLVFDYMDYDLTGIILHPLLKLTEANIKWFCRQLIDVLCYLHSFGIIHRDLKTSNLLISRKGQLKLADFGLARTQMFWKKTRVYTNRVITLWYRPMELLLGQVDYGCEVDMWSVGCILMDMVNQKCIFNTHDEVSQIQAIYELLGTQKFKEWEGAKCLPWYSLVYPSSEYPCLIDEKFSGNLSPQGMDWMKNLLQYDPSKRITAKESLSHDFLRKGPKPEPPNLDNLDDWHEMNTKKDRKSQ